MVFRRSDFHRLGGVPAIGGNLAEDTAISVGLARLGLKTVFAHRTIAQKIGARRLSEVFHRQVRWSVIRRANVVSYPLEPLSSPLPAACAAALASPLAGYPAFVAFCVTLAGWFCAETAFAAAKGWDISFWSPLSFLGREGLSLAAWLRGWTTYQVIWANHRFDARHGPAASPQKSGPPKGRGSLRGEQRNSSGANLEDFSCPDGPGHTLERTHMAQTVEARTYLAFLLHRSR